MSSSRHCCRFNCVLLFAVGLKVGPFVGWARRLASCACSFVEARERKGSLFVGAGAGVLCLPHKEKPAQKNLSRTLVLLYQYPTMHYTCTYFLYQFLNRPNGTSFQLPPTTHSQMFGRFYPHSSCWPKRFLTPTWREISVIHHVEPAVRIRSWEVRRWREFSVTRHQACHFGCASRR